MRLNSKEGSQRVKKLAARSTEVGHIDKDKVSEHSKDVREVKEEKKHVKTSRISLLTETKSDICDPFLHIDREQSGGTRGGQQPEVPPEDDLEGVPKPLFSIFKNSKNPEMIIMGRPKTKTLSKSESVQCSTQRDDEKKKVEVETDVARSESLLEAMKRKRKIFEKVRMYKGRGGKKVK